MTMSRIDRNDHHDVSIEARAYRRVKMKIGFGIHALVYVLVNLGLYAINNMTGDFRWNIFPMMGWGLGLAIHGIVTALALSGDGLRERMVQSEIDHLRRQQ
jgi:hypothetical protein